MFFVSFHFAGCFGVFAHRPLSSAQTVTSSLRRILSRHSVIEIVVRNTDGLADITVFLRRDPLLSSHDCICLLLGPVAPLGNKCLLDPVAGQILTNSSLDSQNDSSFPKE